MATENNVTEPTPTVAVTTGQAMPTQTANVQIVDAQIGVATQTANVQTSSVQAATPETTTEQATNVITDETGQYDTRFILWRTFCAEAGVSVDSLPSELEGDLRERWDKMKDNQLHKPTEQQPTPPVSN